MKFRASLRDSGLCAKCGALYAQHVKGRCIQEVVVAELCDAKELMRSDASDPLPETIVTAFCGQASARPVAVVNSRAEALVTIEADLERIRQAQFAGCGHLNAYLLPTHYTLWVPDAVLGYRPFLKYACRSIHTGHWLVVPR